MRSIEKFIKCLSLTGLALAFTLSGAFANTLSEVQINAENNGYGIVLKTDESAQMKKVISSDDKMTIELKNVDVSQNLNTVYNNVANFDNVTISPISKTDIKIILKGQGIANSKVYFETVKTNAAVTPAAKQAIQLSGPVSSYTPVVHPEDLVAQESQTANPELNETLTKMHITREMLVTVKTYAKKAINKAKSGDINVLGVLGAVIVFAAVLLRPRRKNSAKRGTQPLSRSFAGASDAPLTNLDREIGLNQNMAGTVSNSLNGRYGMNAYQQSQRNPYMSTNAPSTGVSGIARRKPLKAEPKMSTPQAPVRPVSSMSAPIKNQAPKAQAPRAHMAKPKARQAQSSQPSDLDSMKFLESITKIYEKNGRTDLAKGLKDNLRKAQMAKI